ncbi:UNVERIFIED_CONTAM: hypothetical protein Sradi_5853200 [Sesamum radiatum]|uniref:Uncharacterized protein n=1 Tax=Sesamum radiatum TaxID=300843 RepID=A0AAW2KQV2_SESRA
MLLCQSSSSTLVSSTSAGDPKDKHKAEPISTPAKKAKVFTSSLAPPAPKLSMRTGLPRPADVKIKREKLSFDEAPFLLKEEDEGNQFLKGLLSPPNIVFLEVLPLDQAMKSLVSHISNIRRKKMEKN